mmetsp:Transcript_38736/g.37075  ORF Transcript_38736/g.37075 Transcript_38736/m.37075 type:complete len:149 (+) Transcript_38736:875-1321(+)
MGHWKNNMITGVGRQEWTDGRWYEGEFVENLMNGFGRFRFSDGKKYEGFYLDDKKHGFGIFSWLNGKRYEGWWADGKQDGLGALYSQKRVECCQWVQGEKKKVFSKEELKKMGRDQEKSKIRRQNSQLIDPRDEDYEKNTFAIPDIYI